MIRWKVSPPTYEVLHYQCRSTQLQHHLASIYTEQIYKREASCQSALIHLNLFGKKLKSSMHKVQLLNVLLHRYHYLTCMYINIRIVTNALGHCHSTITTHDRRESEIACLKIAMQEEREIYRRKLATTDTGGLGKR
jgi:hypothetical protein